MEMWCPDNVRRDSWELGWATYLEHGSTPQSGVEAPRLLNTEPSQIELLLVVWLFGCLVVLLFGVLLFCLVVLFVCFVGWLVVCLLVGWLCCCVVVLLSCCVGNDAVVAVDAAVA